MILRTTGKLTKVSDFGNIIVSSPRGQPIYLSDIATVNDSTVEKTSLTRLNGKTAVGLDIKKQSGSNTVNVADAVKKQLPTLQKRIAI